MGSHAGCRAPPARTPAFIVQAWTATSERTGARVDMSAMSNSVFDARVSFRNSNTAYLAARPSWRGQCVADRWPGKSLSFDICRYPNCGPALAQRLPPSDCMSAPNPRDNPAVKGSRDADGYFHRSSLTLTGWVPHALSFVNNLRTTPWSRSLDRFRSGCGHELQRSIDLYRQHCSNCSESFFGSYTSVRLLVSAFRVQSELQ